MEQKDNIKRFDLTQFEEAIEQALLFNKMIKKLYKKTKRLKKVINRFNAIIEVYAKAMMLSQFSKSFTAKKDQPNFSV